VLLRTNDNTVESLVIVRFREQHAQHESRAAPVVPMQLTN
jgi:hypothetical protein